MKRRLQSPVPKVRNQVKPILEVPNQDKPSAEPEKQPINEPKHEKDVVKDPVEHAFTQNSVKTREEHLSQWETFLRNEAYRCWNRLPVSLRVWIDPEDLYQEAYMEALRAFAQWDPTISGFSTVMYRFVKNHLASLVIHWACKKRAPLGQIPLIWIDFEGNEVNVVDQETLYRKYDISVDPVLLLVVDFLKKEEPCTI